MTTTTTLTVPSAAERAATVEALRAQSRQAAQRSAESWERSDTDGFLSQWANDSTARRYLVEADLAENGGLVLWKVPAQAALFLPEARWGSVWMLLDENDQQVGFAKPGARKVQWVWALVPARVRGFGGVTITYAATPLTRRSDEYPTYATEAEAEAALAALLGAS